MAFEPFAPEGQPGPDPVAAEDLVGIGEDELAMANIQGNVAAGFNKPFLTLLYFHIDEAVSIKDAVAELAPRVARADDVLKFNRCRSARLERGENVDDLTATWVNIAFSCAGLRKLTDDVDQFADASFQRGLIKQSAHLGDPQDGPDRPDGWKVKDGEGPGTTDMLVIVAADVLGDLTAEVKEVVDLVTRHGGVTSIEPDHGRTLGGNEHFGFRDNIARPGIRGRASANQADFVTPRPDPAHPDRGKAGQELVWPGEFVFGYRGQDAIPGPGPVDWLTDGAGFSLAPRWAKDGSYLVFRRLRQDVPLFHRFLAANRGKRTSAALGARIIGRWPSGAPFERTPERDAPEFAEDNDFDFPRPPAVASSPGNAHIRKVNPRSDVPGAERLRHRVLRRGIPFGAASASTIDNPGDDDGVERGLLFLAYMTSVANQFEFVTRKWAENADFHAAGVGTDALLRQPGQNWITPAGGGYFFSPSISALTDVLAV